MSAKPHVLFIDNFDSFSFNLVDALSQCGADVDVYRNDISAERALAIAERKNSALIVLSPGPGTPEDAGCCVSLIRQAAGRFPILGVCLGHQAIVAAFGGVVASAGEIVHGKRSRIRHDGEGVFVGLPGEIEVGRYHSLAATSLPEALNASAHCGSLVMAVRHCRYPIHGLQFHPESILTTQGQRLLQNALDLAVGARRAA